MFFNLPFDMMIETANYLNADEFYTLYLSVVEKIQNELKKCTIICKTVISDNVVEWFDQNKIKLQLWKEHVTTLSGNLECYKTNGKYHSENDQPSYILDFFMNGKKTCYWYKMDILHRDNDLPAKIFSDGSCEWYVNGKRIKQRLINGEIRYY